MRLDAAERDAQLDALMARHPDAYVAATDENGHFVPMPAAVGVEAHRILGGGSAALEMLVIEDHMTVIGAWDRARRTGAGGCVVHPAADPAQTVRLDFVDATDRYGVFLGFLSGFHGELHGRSLDEIMLRPRLSVVRKDDLGIVTAVDSAAPLMLGWRPDELVGHRTLDFTHPDDRDRAIASWLEMLGSPGAARRVRLRHRHRDGHWLWLEVTHHNLLADPGHGYVLAEMVDITDEMAAHDALRASEQLLRRLTETLPLGVLQLDRDRRVVYQNERIARVLRTGVGEALGERQFLMVVPADRKTVEDALDAVLLGRDSTMEYGYRHARHGLRRCSATLRALSTDTGEVTGAIVCLGDVTEEVRLRDELKHRATYDSLTGCRNRASTVSALAALLAAPAPGNAGIAVIFIDLNEFKQVNDRYGHAAGDQLLTLVAACLRGCVRDEDIVGRFGGDEFVVVCRDIRGTADARRIGETLLVALDGSRLDLAGASVMPQASVGVTWSAPGHCDADALIARADAAMYEAKKRRTGRFALAMSE